MERKQSWGKKKIKGEVYDLGHLDAFIMPVTPKAPNSPTFKVAVFFGPHTFTVKFEEGDKPDVVILSERVRRTFCPIRYQLSLRLPALIRDASAGLAFLSHGGNYVFMQRYPDLNEDYVVAFDLVRAERKQVDVILNVLSAYPRQNHLPDLKTIPFTALIAKTARGEAINR